MTPYVLHDKSGRIMQTGHMPEFMLEAQDAGGLSLVCGEGDTETHYVKGGALLDRPKQYTELAGSTLVGLPVPCSIRINSAAYGCNEPVATLDFPYPGSYTITITAFPYLDATFTFRKP